EVLDRRGAARRRRGAAAGRPGDHGEGERGALLPSLAERTVGPADGQRTSADLERRDLYHVAGHRHGLAARPGRRRLVAARGQLHDEVAPDPGRSDGSALAAHGA
ncbi:unnamed protein product, partial [Durusdinium trenchii]